jgi:6-phosphogluconolactonase (cycloisomerase 2 family)
VRRAGGLRWRAVIALFSRDAATGDLAFVEAVGTAHAPLGLILTRDGRHLYSTGGQGGANANPPILGFERKPATGQLTLVFTDPSSLMERCSSAPR